MGISMILAGFNMIVTIINYRAPGMRWSRLPMFVWSMFTVSFLQVLAVPVLVGACYMGLMDRTFQTAFFTNQLGGSSFLYEDLFWFFGHPEVYILALPGFGVISEVVSVFCRKPLFGYRIAAAGMLGVGILSFFVWQHHLFVSGINADMRPLFMLTTELISIPTGFIYLVGMGTFWKAKIRFSIPMLFALAFYFNFLIGGISGVFLSDVPADTTEHGSFFVMAHFHYTIMGGLIFAFLAGIYYWLPKMTGHQAERDAGQAPLLDHVHLLQHHLPAVVRARPDGHAAPRVRIRAQPGDAQRLGVDLRVLPGRLDTHLPDQLRHVHALLAGTRGGQPVAGPQPGMAGVDAAAAGELQAGAGDPVRPV